MLEKQQNAYMAAEHRKTAEERSAILTRNGFDMYYCSFPLFQQEQGFEVLTSALAAFHCSTGIKQLLSQFKQLPNNSPCTIAL